MATVPDIEIGIHHRIDIVRPGDKLLMAVDGDPGDTEIEKWRDTLATKLPGVELVVFNTSSLLVYRPDSPEQPSELAESCGYTAYSLYRAAGGLRDLRGSPMPDWDDLPGKNRAEWATAAAGVQLP
jgi:hypothetical protein